MRAPSRSTVLKLAAAAAAAFALGACNGQGAGGKAAAGDMSLGNPQAPIKFVEYASASCTHCARWNEQVFPAFKAKYVDTGQVQYTLKEFLTPPAEVAAAGFLLARCAEAQSKGKYFPTLDAIYRSQGEMLGDGTTSNVRPVMLRIAQSVGLTPDQFDSCVRDEKALASLNDRVEQSAKDSGITGTPAFFVNGKKVSDQEMSLAEIDAAVAAAKAGK